MAVFPKKFIGNLVFLYPAVFVFTGKADLPKPHPPGGFEAKPAINTPSEETNLRFTSLEKHLTSSDLDILFGHTLKNENNKILNIREAFNVFTLDVNENLCKKTADNWFADNDSGLRSSHFIIRTKDFEMKFAVTVSEACRLAFSYSYSENCYNCSTSVWGKYNPIVQMKCDKIYVNNSQNLICEKAGLIHTVNINYLRFLNKYSACFDSKGYYYPKFPALSAEETFYECVEQKSPGLTGRQRLSLCSLNLQLLTHNSPIFWLTNFDKRFENRHVDFPNNTDCTKPQVVKRLYSGP